MNNWRHRNDISQLHAYTIGNRMVVVLYMKRHKWIQVETRSEILWTCWNFNKNSILLDELGNFCVQYRNFIDNLIPKYWQLLKIIKKLIEIIFNKKSLFEATTETVKLQLKHCIESDLFRSSLVHAYLKSYNFYSIPSYFM